MASERRVSRRTTAIVLVVVIIVVGGVATVLYRPSAGAKEFHVTFTQAMSFTDVGVSKDASFKYTPVVVGEGETASGTVSLKIGTAAAAEPTYGSVEVEINGKKIGSVDLTSKEQPFTLGFEPSILKQGDNALKITSKGFKGNVEWYIDVVVV